MFRQTSSRNHRSKGFKVKHILQIFMLVAICLWLLYQIKHSHDKRIAFDENNAKIANKIDEGREIMQFGRKDLNHGVEMTSRNEEHGEEEENEDEEEIDNSHEILKFGKKDTKHGVEMASKDEKHVEEEESEEQEGKGEGEVDEERGNGDDEIDEHDQEKVDEEAEREEYFTEEEKETIEREKEEEGKTENEENDGQSEGMDSRENHDLAGDERNSQEAREQHYKGDDASSAVVRDNKMTTSEVDNESRNPEEHVDNIEKIDLENDQKTNKTEEATVNENDSNPKVGEFPIARGAEKTTINNPSVNATSDVEGVEFGLSKLENDRLSDINTTESPNEMVLHNNVTVDNTETPTLYPVDETSTSKLMQAQNATLKMEASIPKHPNSPQQMEKPSTTAIVEEIQTGESEKTDKSNATILVEETKNNVLEETALAKDFEKVESKQTEKFNTSYVVEESVENVVHSHTSENADVVQSETIDSSTSLLNEEERDSVIDLGTLPEIESQGRNTEDVAAE